MNREVESKRTLERILESIDVSALKKSDLSQFEARLNLHFPRLFCLLLDIYGHRYDFYYYLQELTQTLVDGYASRSNVLKQKDQQRIDEPQWYQSEKMLGMACYVDLFAGDIKGLQQKIPYLESLGVTYLHLMPLYDSPKGDSDGGYAVSDYRKVDSKLGNMRELKELAEALTKKNISLVLDFVFNHTSDEHKWALAAKNGDKEFQDYYFMFDDRTLPDQYEQSLREIFPQVRRGNFTWEQASKKWVWTTFNNFQWDLNYSNPAVFNAITAEMLFLANIGCEALRLDALAFIWKEMGTTCENQDNAHKLIQAFNCCLQIAAPAVVFKSEAIVHPDEVLKYIDEEECQLSYNPLLMALIWNSLATRKTRLLTESLQQSFTISPTCSWVNYIRCHDDIGWTFDDKVAWKLGINGHDHRNFLNQFYTGRFEGSFANGVAFGENPSTGDCRVCGSLASLAGLEQAKSASDPVLIEHAVGRINLVNAVIMAIGGIPLLYSGDELALTNDYSYRQNPSKQHDDRWVQRIAIAEQGIGNASNQLLPEYTIAQTLKKLINTRKSLPILGQSETQVLVTDNQHIFAFTRRQSNGQVLLSLNNFSDVQQKLDAKVLDHVGSDLLIEKFTGAAIDTDQHSLSLKPYASLWIMAI